MNESAQQIVEARHAVSRALEELVSLETGQPVVVTDWIASVEYTLGDTLALRASWSANMTQWKAPGMAKHITATW